jgi:DNA-binding LacI/PurR family transcriptional regulator
MPNLIDQHIRIPRYLTVSEELRTRILNGQYKAGDRLPSYNEMRQLFDADQRTVEKTYALLEEEGLIRRIAGRGAFVNEANQREATGFIGFLDDSSGRNLPFFMEIQRGARQCCADSGNSLATIDNPLQFGLWSSLDGLLRCDMGLHEADELVDVMRPDMPQVKLFYPTPGISSVGADDRMGVKMAMEHLFELGHRRIAYFGSVIDGHPYLEARHLCFEQLLLEQGVTPAPEWTYLEGKPDEIDYREHGYRVMCNWLKEGWRELGLTAILAQNDHMARGLIHALHEHGYSVPNDISVVGFDGLETSKYVSFSLTTVVLPLREMGRVAMNLLQQHIENPALEAQVIELPVTLYVGNSTKKLKEVETGAEKKTEFSQPS